MSKSLGNSPDPIELMNQFGADGVRVGMLLTSPAGNDLPFDEKLCEQGRNFANKIWNAFRLTQSWEVDANREQPESAEVAVRWMKARVQRVLEELEGQFAEFRLSEALMNLYRLVSGPRTADRILALDTMVINVIALIVLYGIWIDSQTFFEASMLIAMVGFVSTVAYCRFVLRGNIIE